eukprot:gene6768-2616_t
MSEEWHGDFVRSIFARFKYEMKYLDEDWDAWFKARNEWARTNARMLRHVPDFMHFDPEEFTPAMLARILKLIHVTNLRSSVLIMPVFFAASRVLHLADIECVSHRLTIELELP